jgi:hypothetical protein
MRFRVCAHCWGGIWASRSASWAAAVDTRLGRSGALERSHLWFRQSAMSAGLLQSLCTSVELCVVVNHEHHLPLEDIAVHQATAYAGYALVVLHLLELARQQSGRSRGRRHDVRRCVVGMPARALFKCRSRVGVATEMCREKGAKYRRKALL